jgi:dihydrofolate synthase / folylpolyglutamate synthase
VSTDALREVEAALRTRWPESKIEPSLERITDVMDVLGNPQRAYPVIHIAGTNGKTSTARMVDALLRELGLRTGRFTSPHLESVTERICLDGEPIDDDRFAAVYDEVAPFLDLIDQQHDIRLSYFEALTAMAYATFADAPVDVAIIEVGMGGSWDATNVVEAQVAVVTPVSLDHADYLGDDVRDIAAEKAGIIKPGSTVISGVQLDDVAEILTRRAAEVGSDILREGVDFSVRARDVAVGGQMVTFHGLSGQYDDVFLPLHGAHQASNAACAITAVEVFVGGGTAALDADAVRAALGETSSPGRLEVVRRSPSIVVDAAHNPAGMRVVAEAIQEEFSFTRLVAVVAVLGDKDVRGILEELEAVVSAIVVTSNSSPRALPVDELANVAAQVFGEERVIPVPGLPDAIDRAVGLVEDEAMYGGAGVLITGSVVTAGDARHLLGGRR